jgi:hypothetical protein
MVSKRIGKEQIEKILFLKLKNNDSVRGKLMAIEGDELKMKIVLGHETPQGRTPEEFECWFDRSEIYWWGQANEVVKTPIEIIKKMPVVH